jgi:hypothetical protein
MKINPVNPVGSLEIKKTLGKCERGPGVDPLFPLFLRRFFRKERFPNGSNAKFGIKQSYG